MNAVVSQSILDEPGLTMTQVTTVRKAKKNPVSYRREMRSCSECRRRKLKCVFEDIANCTAACNACMRRGSRCTSQNPPTGLARSQNEAQSPQRLGVVSPIARSRSLNNFSEAKPGQAPTDQTAAIHTIASQITAALLHDDNEAQQPSRQALNDCDRISKLLYKSLPTKEDIKMIQETMPQYPMLVHEILTLPYTLVPSSDKQSSFSPSAMPDVGSHPVVLARYMLILATLLQHVHPGLHHRDEQLSIPPSQLSRILAMAAIDHVTTNDEFLGSVEAVECIMIESVYHANLGNLRQSWITARRAMSVAQMTGLSRSQCQILDTGIPHHPKSIWLRIVFLERFLSLLLGLTPGCADANMTSESLLLVNEPMERLERIHCVAAARVLERNMKTLGLDDIAVTRAIDVELQRAARSLPSTWWLLPILDQTQTVSNTLLWNTGRIFGQVVHYNLLIQLHHHFMLRSSAGGVCNEYARMTCVTASREILTRFVALRSFNKLNSGCRIIDYIAVMAALCLLLVHIDSLCLGADNTLAHQYHSDRAMIEQVSDGFGKFTATYPDSTTTDCASALKRLIALEDRLSGTARPFLVEITMHDAFADATIARDDDPDVVLHFPCFGIVRISQRTQNDTTATMRLNQR